MKKEKEVVVITGGTRGLGRALAEAYIAKGSHVVICSRDRNEVDTVAREIGAVPYAVDITQEDALCACRDYIVAKFGKIDIWINNAGVWMPHSSIETLDIERVRAICAVNIFGTIIGSKLALLQMRKQSFGTIINIISVSALTGHPTSSGYAASKWAVRGFTESLRQECRRSDIRVISVYPGCMKTGLFDEQRPSDIEDYLSPDNVAKKIVKNLTLKKPKEELIIIK